MSKFRENWNKKLWYEKVIFVIGMMTSVAVIVLALLELFNIWEDVLSLKFPLLALIMLNLAFENRKTNHGAAIFELCVAALEIIFWIIVLCL